MTTFYPNDSTKAPKVYRNLYHYMGYNHYHNWFKNYMYAEMVAISEQSNGGALIECSMPDGIISEEWASYNVACDYFLRRSTRFKGANIVLHPYSE